MSDAERRDGRHHLVRKLGSLARLSPADVAAIQALPMTVEDCPASHPLVRERDRPRSCHLILDGFACRHKSLPDEGRQILSFHTPGDILDLQSLYLETMDYGVTTMVPTVVGRLPRETLLDLARSHPGIAQAFWRDTLVDSAIYREWMLSLGRRTARSHLAHLLCEMVTRLAAVQGDAGPDAAVGPMPLGRDDLADALGMTAVEVSRELHGLRHAGLIEFGDASLTVRNQRELARISAFDPAYLHQDNAA